MSDKSLKDKVFSGALWAFGERVISQGVSFVLSIVLARLLMPSEYGVIALVLVFTNLANVFVANGMGETLIQKKDADETDFSSLFYVSLILSIGLYTILFFLAPYIAMFYDNSKLVPVLQVIALILPLSSVITIQQAYVSKQMMFKKMFFATIGGTLASGLIGIFMAYLGFGVWSLVAQYLFNAVVNTIVLFFIAQWRPKLLFSMNSVKKLVGFGWKLVGANLINTFYGELRSLMIGKLYTTTALAYYNRGNQFPSLLITSIDTAIGKVLFPAMVEVNNDIGHIKTVTRRSMKITAYLILPLMIGLVSIAHSLVLVLLTEKWIASVPFLQICCVYWLFQPMQTANWQAIKALGRSDMLVKLEIYKKIIGVCLLLISMNISVYAIAISNTAFAGISMIINMLPNKKLINYSMVEQIRDLAPSLLLALVMGGSIYTISWVAIPTISILLLQIICGAVIYLGASHLFKIDSYVYLSSIITTKLRRRGLRTLAEGAPNV
ncbi:lipopolysaccharide biosynthesis protein [Paenibacillus sp. OV219]|uniref:lipopolysaccharide biosynthesis protein n=1 Tax=Paenibacillus sp. OV219 TaxID=1884377 RepID=UPI0008BB802A|nr:lipopolysaccharide biosynthesis protein [Paenibacillus sp. OV219]SEO64240.1 Membrane protein involved in the export of O-antigen and teichoic acid [Paenibacillus sp. OV219]